jgi:GNAT superfamily N-acetyltransferase
MISIIPADPIIRDLRADDSLGELTVMIHAAYKALGDLGLNYTAVDQDVAVTRARIEMGHCLVAEAAGVCVGTVTWYSPGIIRGNNWYRRQEVAVFGQLAVSPDHQRRGIGSKLIEEVERLAAQAGAREIALDTAELAQHLVAYYDHRGYRVVDHVKWDGKRYRSVIMSKELK